MGISEEEGGREGREGREGVDYIACMYAVGKCGGGAEGGWASNE